MNARFRFNARMISLLWTGWILLVLANDVLLLRFLAWHKVGKPIPVFTVLAILTFFANLSLGFARVYPISRSARPAPPARVGLLIWIVCVVALGAFGMTLRGKEIAERPLGPVESTPDMPRIVDKGVKLLLSGQMPYQDVEVPWKIPMGYQPGMFLPYVSCGLLKIDTRYAASFCSVLVPLLWMIWFRNGSTSVRIVTVLLACLWLFDPLQRNLPAMIQTPTWWPWCTLGALFFLSGRWKTSGVFWGLGLASRQPAAGAVVALAIFLLRRVGWRPTVGFVSCAGAAAAVLYAPFLAVDAHAVLVAPVEYHYRVLETYVIPQAPDWIHESLGFSAYLYKLPGFLDWMIYTQGAAVAAIWLCVALWVRSRAGAVLSAGLCLLVFNYLLHWPVWYLYIPPMLLFTCATLHRLGETGDAKTS